MTQSTHIVKLDNEQAFDALASDWQRLESLNANASLFSGWAWNRLWWKHYSHLGELHVIVCRREGVVRAIAPLYRTRLKLFRVLQTDTLRFLGTGGDTSPDDVDVLIDPDEPLKTLDDLCRFLLNRIDVTRLNWSDLSQDSRFRQRFVRLALQQRGFLRRVQSVERLVQALPASVSEHRASLSRNARKHLKRRHRRLAEAGDATFTYCASHEAVDSVLDTLIVLHRARHLSKGSDHSFASQSYCDFHRALMHTLLERDELRLLSLSLNDQIIGVEYAFESGGALCFFQTGFDPAFRHLSPGHLMMARMIDDAIERGVASLDLLKGEYAYKKHYASVARHSWQIDYCKPGILSVLSRVVERLRRPRRSAIRA